MTRRELFRRLLQAAAVLLIVAGFFGTLWWSGRPEPAQTTPQNWCWELEVLEEELRCAQGALDAGDPAEVEVWLSRARERSAMIKRNIHVDYEAWIAEHY